MTTRHEASAAAVALIKRFEGYRRTAARLANGSWTIGFGHTASAREGASVSEADAEALLTWDLRNVAQAIDAQVYTPLTQNQFDALACFVFNVGGPAFAESAVLRTINEGALLQAAWEIEMWRQADFEGERIVVDALVRRRAAEKALFLTPCDGFVPIPTPVVRPLLDAEVASGAPRQEAVELSAALDGCAAKAVRSAPAPHPPELEPQSEPEPAPFSVAAETAVAAVAANAIAPAVAEEIDPFPAHGQPVTFGQREAPPVEAAPAKPPEPEPVAPEPKAEPAPRRWVDELHPLAYADSVVVAAEAYVPHAVKRAAAALTESYSLLIGLGVIGLSVFIIAVAWIFQAQGRSHPAGAHALGWIAALLGVVCVAAAVYFLLEKSRRDGPPHGWPPHS